MKRGSAQAPPASWPAREHPPPLARVVGDARAQRVVGKLSWGCSHLFKRVGRAMLRPIFDQKSRRDGLIGAELRRALLWWLQILRMGLVELRAWDEEVDRPPVHMFADAQGNPPYLAAVLFLPDQCFFTHMSPPTAVMDKFATRGDRQIMGLELLAISLGLSTFEARPPLTWVGCMGAEGVIRQNCEDRT